MINLLTETRNAIKKSGHKLTDIVFIGSRDGAYRCTWGQFSKLANFEYNYGFGSQKIATDLVIVFADGATMWRHEYDGSEQWQYSVPFVVPETSKPIRTLGGNEHMWVSLAELHKDA